MDQLLCFLSNYGHIFPELKAYLEQHWERVSFKANDIIIKPYALCNFTYFMLDGIALRSMEKNNKHITTWIYLSNTMILIPENIHHNKRSYEKVIALNDCNCLRLSTQNIKMLYLQFPEVIKIEKMIIEQQLKSVHEHAIIKGGPAYERFLYLHEIFNEAVYIAKLHQLGSFIGIDKATYSRLRLKHKNAIAAENRASSSKVN